MTMSYLRADDSLNDSLRAPATPHIWFHTGSPGSAGTANIAQLVGANIVRKALVFGDAPANHNANNERIVKNTAAVTLTGAEITAAQEITHFSIWSAAAAGQFEYASALAQAKTVGSDGLTVAIGDIEVALGVFAKPA